MILTASCNFQSDKKEIMSEKKNFSCDLETSICSDNTDSKIQEIKSKSEAAVKIIYFTDPICSACWAIEPELKKFNLEYGDYFDLEYKMGGLLPNWDGFTDDGSGISKPYDVAVHWEEVGQHTGMSIDGDVWLKDPLDSSYPPSIAFKAMQNQGKEKAILFLRAIREMVFLNQVNITKVEYLVAACEKVGGDKVLFLKDYKNPITEQAFFNDINECREMGVSGFPTLIFTGKESVGYKISGSSRYDNYKLALEKAYGDRPMAKAILFNEYGILKKYKYLSTIEISTILSDDEATTLANLNLLVSQGLITKEKQKHGLFWRFVD
jgi:predicted DsbA family dithiol-disulfide isomerase